MIPAPNENETVTVPKRASKPVITTIDVDTQVIADRDETLALMSECDALRTAADAVLAAWQKGALTDLMFEPIKQLRAVRNAR